jgi:phage/plasmid-associated DNA primase
VVLDATSKYFGEQDTLRQWVEECCKSGTDYADTNSSLFSSCANYAKSRGEEVGSQKRFRPAMERLDFTPIKDEHGIRGVVFGG